MADDPMWSMVMFDLPVLTSEERRGAASFRKLLLDGGYMMLQFSVYVKYVPTGGQNHALLTKIKRSLPPGGDIRIFHISDRQWANAFRFHNAAAKEPETTPTQLAFF